VDSEGRWLQADYDGLSIVSFYLPSGSASPERHQRKLEFMERIYEEFRALRRKKREFIICGDINIVHKEIDITNWKSNQKNSGCTPEERAWLDRLFDELGYVDAFRVVDPRPGQYTWWSNRGRAREKNVGWRIDYQIITPGLKDKVLKARIYKDKWFSDHAPLIMTSIFDFSTQRAQRTQRRLLMDLCRHRDANRSSIRPTKILSSGLSSRTWPCRLSHIAQPAGHYRG